MRSSARNQFNGSIARVRRGAVNDEIDIDLPGGERLVAVVTHESARQMRLRRGVEVVAWVKASWILVVVEQGEKLLLSARNQLRGRVLRVRRGAVNSEVIIGLGADQQIVATVTNVSARALKLKRGASASAIFKASSVIVGVRAP